MYVRRQNVITRNVFTATLLLKMMKLNFGVRNVHVICDWILLHGGNKNCVHLDLKYQMKFVCVYIRNESHFLSCAFFFPTLLHFIRLHSFSIEWKSLSWIFLLLLFDVRLVEDANPGCWCTWRHRKKVNKTKLNWKSQNKYNKHQRNAVNIQSNHPICPSFFSICTACSLWCSSNEFYLFNKCVFQFVFSMTDSPFDICVPNLMAKNGFFASIVPKKMLSIQFKTHFKRIFLLETIFPPFDWSDQM